jgi:peptidoglycan/xylan/chitin deacetylase (PgdA/CDA1 family)
MDIMTPSKNREQVYFKFMQRLLRSDSKIMFKHTIPFFIRLITPMLTWKVQTADKSVFLTFDDGPHPQITPWVLGQLEQFKAKATFFCVGQNVERYSQTYQQLLEAGHTAGNHTFNHLNGWKTPTQVYLNNVAQASKVMDTKLFRPPYGRIGLGQLRALRKQGYQVVMWDVLTCDYEKNLDTTKALKHILRSIKPGSIVVFHDSEKAQQQLEILLPEVLKQLLAKGFSFKSLPV